MMTVTGTVQYYDIVLRVGLNSSELTEILKMVKYNNICKKSFFSSLNFVYRTMEQFRVPESTQTQFSLNVWDANLLSISP